ncbi:MAG: hypothetical protein GYA18_12015 [Chloroflexi bacterium]|nr:hypothetical protein [Chloroflexota bacterium]
MSRVINRNNYSSQRTSYMRFVATALRHLPQDNRVDDNYKDIGVFIFLTLREISNSVQKTIQPWEKRGYWVKADQFRKEWEWLDPLYNAMKKKIHDQAWNDLKSELQTLCEICCDYPPYQRMPVSDPWRGSWKKWEKMKEEAG